MKPFFLRAAGLALLLVTLFSCKKDNWVVEDFTTPAFHSITIEEARRSFESRLGSLGSLDGSDKQFIDLKPEWDRAALGHAQSGREIIVVPLSDRSIDSLNQGRADVKLQFVKLAGDSILIDVLLYCADSSYAAGHLNGFSYSDFTGAVISYDLLFDVQWGVYVEQGQVVARLDSVSQRQVTNGEAASTRGGGGTTLICNSHVSVWRECGSIYSQECWYEVSYWFECHEIGSDDPNSGGGGSSSSGGSWGPGNNGNPNNGEPDIPFPTHPELDCSVPQYYWACLYYDAIATHLFSDDPNAPEVPLPYGFDEAMFDNLKDIIKAYKLDKLAAQWLITHRDLIDEIHSQLPTGNEPTPTSPDPDDPNPEVPVDMKELIEFCAEVGLNQEQWRYLLENPGFLEAMKEVFHGNFRDEKAKYAVKSTINLQMNGWFDKADWTEAELEDVLANELKPILYEHYIQIVQEYIYLRYADPRFKDPCNFWCATKAWAQATYNVSIGVVHTIFDVCGLVPGWGEPCDFANGVLYTIEGDGVNATLSFAATLPIAGWAATGAKWAGVAFIFKGIKHDLKVTRVGNFLDFGDRGNLRTVLNITDSNKEAHHIIPWEHRELPIVQKAAESANVPYHMNHYKNGKELEKFRYDTNPDGTHANHPQYNTAVRVKLESLWDELEDHFGPGNVPSDVASTKLIELQNNIGAVIDANPNTKINLLNLSGVQIPTVP